MKKFLLTLFILTGSAGLITALNSCGGSTTTNVSTVQPATGSPTSMQTTVVIGTGSVGKGPAAFGTNPLNITVGTTVIWVNQDTVNHTTTSDTGVWNSGTLMPGQSFSFQFNSPGLFPYHCAIHGAASMSGAVNVTGGSPSPSPTVTPFPTRTPLPTVTPSPRPSVSPSAMPSPSATATATATASPVPSASSSP